MVSVYVFHLENVKLPVSKNGTMYGSRRYLLLTLRLLFESRVRRGSYTKAAAAIYAPAPQLSLITVNAVNGIFYQLLFENLSDLSGIVVLGLASICSSSSFKYLCLQLARSVRSLLLAGIGFFFV